MGKPFKVSPKAERTVAGRSFASKGEKDCYLYLKLLEKDNQIDSIECQVTTPLAAGISHRTDFTVFDLKLGEKVWVEYKGFEDQRWRDIRKLWKVFGPGRLRVYRGYGHRISITEEIIPDRTSLLRSKETPVT